MVELIKKDVLSEEIESLTVRVTGLRAGKGVLSNFMDEYRKSVLRVIDEQPTTTEAEIRAKAIEEFAKKLDEKIGEFILGHKDNLDFASGISVAWNMVDEIAEQLKEN